MLGLKKGKSSDNSNEDKVENKDVVINVIVFVRKKNDEMKEVKVHYDPRQKRFYIDEEQGNDFKFNHGQSDRDKNPRYYDNSWQYYNKNKSFSPRYQNSSVPFENNSVTQQGAKPKSCFKCGKTGHLIKQCNRGKVCYVCGKEGHISTQCYRRNDPKQEEMNFRRLFHPKNRNWDSGKSDSRNEAVHKSTTNSQAL